MKIIRDAIHNNIELEEAELAVLDAPEMQRLRYVRQLALAYLVYPSAHHTRFEHSLGTMHLTKILSPRVLQDEGERRLLSIAALLHDVGHSAFSHLPEPLLQLHLRKDHEQLGEEKIRTGSIASILEKNGIRPKELLKIYKGLQGKIISSDLGTDRMDYLLRDSYFTGVGYSLIDAQRLLLSLSFHRGALAVQEKGVLAAESLLVSRYLMFNAVYNHHAVRIASEMLLKALSDSLEAGEIGIPELQEGSDDMILFKLRSNPLIGKILARDLFKSAFEMPEFDSEKRKADSLKRGLGEALLQKLDPSEFVICMPQTSLGGTDIPILRDDGSTYGFSRHSLLSLAVSKQRKASGIIVATEKKNAALAKRICSRSI